MKCGILEYQCPVRYAKASTNNKIALCRRGAFGMIISFLQIVALLSSYCCQPPFTDL